MCPKRCSTRLMVHRAMEACKVLTSISFLNRRWPLWLVWVLQLCLFSAVANNQLSCLHRAYASGKKDSAIKSMLGVRSSIVKNDVWVGGQTESCKRMPDSIARYGNFI